jgi:hypothetical protein
MRELEKLSILVTLALVLNMTSVAHGAYFVFEKLGNIRSGPGTKYRVIGQLSKETVVEIPSSFSDFDAAWIPIDARIERNQATKSEKVVYTKWTHRSLGAVVRGDLDDVDKYLAIRSSGWKTEIQELVLKGRLKPGMTTHMVFYAWGRPDEIIETSTPDGASEQWVYKKSTGQTRYLYFKDGLLIRTQPDS